jgi:flavin reductase (DIM6/NTAB) family NADH-FMN oxidoreductase RutF
MSRHAAGVVVATCVVDGLQHAMTATSFTSVSLHPLEVLVCVSGTSRSGMALARARSWGVSVLGADGVGTARWLSRPGRPLEGQLDEVPHHLGRTGVPLLDGALAHFECETRHLHPTGDHHIVVGEVLHLALPDDLGTPLLYWARGFRGIADLPG